MSRWEGALASAGFRPDTVDEPAAWSHDDVADPRFDVLADVVRTNLRVAAAESLDDLRLPAGDEPGLRDDLAPSSAGTGEADDDDLVDDLTRPGRGTVDESHEADESGVDRASADPATATGDGDLADGGGDPYTMTADVLGFDVDPDAFASAVDAVLDQLVDVDPPVQETWHEPVTRLDDALDAEADLAADDLDEPGDWHLPR